MRSWRTFQFDGIALRLDNGSDQLHRIPPVILRPVNGRKQLHVIDLHTFFNCNSESVSFPMPNERITDFSFWNVLCFTISYENLQKMNMNLHWLEEYGIWSLHHDLWSSEYRRFYYHSKLANIFLRYEAFLDPIAEFRWVRGKSIPEMSIFKV